MYPVVGVRAILADVHRGVVCGVSRWRAADPTGPFCVLASYPCALMSLALCWEAASGVEAAYGAAVGFVGATLFGYGLVRLAPERGFQPMSGEGQWKPE